MGEQSVVLGLGSKIEAGTKQAFTTIADGFRAIANGMSTSAQSMRQLGQEAPAKLFEEAAKSINKVTANLDKQIAGTKQLTKAQVAAKQVLQEATAAQVQSSAAVTDANNKSWQSHEKLSVAQQRLRVNFADLRLSSDKYGESANKIFANMRKYTLDTRLLEASLKLLVNRQKEAARVETGEEKRSKAISSLRIRYQELTNETSKYGVQATKLIANLAQYDANLDKTANALKILTQRQRDAAQSDATVKKRAEDIAALKVQFSSLITESSKFQKQAINQIATLNNYGVSVRSVSTKLMEMKQSQQAANILDNSARTRAEQIAVLKIRYEDLAASTSKYGAQAKALLATTAQESTSLRIVAASLGDVAKKQREFDTTSTAAKKRAEDIQILTGRYEKLLVANNKYGDAARRLMTDLKNLDGSVRSTTAQLALLAPKSSALDKQAQDIQKLRVQYAELRHSTDRYGVAANKVIANTERLNLSTIKSADALAFFKRQQKEAEGSFTTLSGAINTTIKKLQSYAGYMVASSMVFAFIGATKSAVTAVAAYDQSLKDLQAITQPTNEQLESMATTMKSVATDSKFSAAETAEGMKLLGQAGYEAVDVVDAIPAVVNLATGTLSDMSTVVDLSTTAIRAFGLEAKDTGYVADLFANAVNRSKLTIADISTAFNYIAPAAHNAGMSLEETTRIMMVLRDNGFKASTMATNFRQILEKLVVPTKAFKKHIADAGMSLEDFDVAGLGISKVLHNLGKVIKTNEDAFVSFGSRGSAAALALIKDVGRFDELGGKLDKSGASAKMAEIQMQGLENMFKNLQAKIGNLFITMGEGGLIGVLKSLVNVARTAIDVLNDLASNSLVQWGVRAVIAYNVTKLLAGAFTLLRNSAIIGSVMSAVGVSVGALSSVMAQGTISTVAMTAALDGLKMAAMRFAPAAILTAIGALVYSNLTYTQSLKDAKVEQEALGKSSEDAVVSLGKMEKSLASGSTSQQEQKSIVDGLTKKYGDFGVELRNAGTDGTKLIEVLNKIKAAEEQKGKLAMAESMRLTALQLADNVKSQESWLTAIRNSIQSEELAKNSKEGFIKKNKELVESMIVSAKTIGKTDAEIYTGFSEMLEKGLLGGQSDVIMGRVKEVLDSLSDPAKESGRKVGKAFTDGTDEGLDPQQIKDKAEEFNKSLATVEFKAANQDLEKSLASQLYQMEVASAKGVVTHDEAEMSKLNTTIGVYDKMVEVAQKYAAEANKGGTEEQQIEAQTKVDAAIEKANQVRLQKLQNLGKQREAVEDKIAEKQKKVTDEVTKYDDKRVENRKAADEKIIEAEASAALRITEIAEDSASKRLEADKDYEDKRKDLVKERVEIERDAAADIKGLEDSLADKITNIRMKGLTGEAKEGALAAAATDRLAAGKKSLAEASAKNDKDAIARSKQLIESASGYYDQLENPDAAIRGLESVTAALVEARKAQEKAELANNAEKLQKEVDQHNEKIAKIDASEDVNIKKAIDRLALKKTVIDTHFADQELKETNRHNKEMADLQLEINKLKEKSQVLSSQQTAVTSTTPPVAAGAPGATPNINDPGFNMEQYERDVGIATARGIQNGVTSGTAAAGEQIKEAVGTSVASGVQAGIFDGVKVEGLPLEEWKAQGKKQGEVMAEAVAEEVKQFDITENLEGKPVSVVIKPAAEEDVDPLIESIKAALKAYPGEPELDFEKAEEMLRAFVRQAQSKYRIEIPVTTAQAQATGGQVYAMAAGGKIPGTKSPKDKVTVKSRPGEWYIPDEQASFWSKNVGSWFMNAVHKPMSQAGQMLKDSVLKGPNSRAVPVPVSAGGGAQTDVLSSLSNFGTLNIKIGNRTAKVLASSADAQLLALQFKRLEDASSS